MDHVDVLTPDQKNILRLACEKKQQWQIDELTIAAVRYRLIDVDRADRRRARLRSTAALSEQRRVATNRLRVIEIIISTNAIPSMAKKLAKDRKAGL